MSASRNMSAAMLTEIAKQKTIMLRLVKFDFSTVQYITDYSKNISWLGNDYQALGNLLSISEINETTNIAVNNVQIKLSGVNQANISTALSENYIDKTVEIYLAALDSNYALIIDPVFIYSGRINNFTLNEDITNNKSILTWNVANHWIDFSSYSGRRTNHNDQTNVFPGDAGLIYAGTIVKDLRWGKY